MQTIEIPDELMAEAQDIPDLRERVARFIKLEVVLHRHRGERHSPETLQAVANAKNEADRMRGENFDRSRVAEELRDFVARLPRDS
jgi:hypothetical protein